MGRPRQPVDLLLQKGTKHLTKEEIEQRRASEVKPCPDGIEAPAYLTQAQKTRFRTLAEQLKKINIMGETDVDTLARYVVAQSLYEQAVKDIRVAQRAQPKGADATTASLATWAAMMKELDRRQDRYFKQAQTCASTLGLTITARCGLEVPVPTEAPKANKFAKFEAKR